MSNLEYFNTYNREYLGCKTRLLPFIEEVVNDNVHGVSRVADLFAGTGVIGDFFNRRGCDVIVNDSLYHNYLSYLTFFDDAPVDTSALAWCIELFNENNVIYDNYFSTEYGGNYFKTNDARKIGWIRDYIEDLASLNPRERAILITSLIYAADKSSNTCGHYHGHRPDFSYKKIPEFKLRFPLFDNVLNEGNECFNMDANLLAPTIDADLVYIDPPYNSRHYIDYYHVLENLAVWDKGELEGKLRQPKWRADFRSKHSSKRNAFNSFKDLIYKLDGVDYLLVSYNDNPKNNIAYDDMISLLEEKGNVSVFKKEFPRYRAKNSDDSHVLHEQLFLCEV